MAKETAYDERADHGEYYPGGGYEIGTNGGGGSGAGESIASVFMGQTIPLRTGDDLYDATERMLKKMGATVEK